MNERGHNLVNLEQLTDETPLHRTQEVSKMSPVMFNNNALLLNKHFFNLKQHTF